MSHSLEQCHPSGSPRVCSICGCRELALENALLAEKRWIKPCYCNRYCHHYCISGRIKEEKRCAECGIKYDYTYYGTLTDWVVRNVVEVSCCGGCLLIGILLTGLTFFAASSSSGAWSIGWIVFGSFLGLLVVSTSLFCFLYVTCRCFPLWTERYEYVRFDQLTRVYDYVPTLPRSYTRSAANGRPVPLETQGSCAGCQQQQTLGQKQKMLQRAKETPNPSSSATILIGCDQDESAILETSLEAGISANPMSPTTSALLNSNEVSLTLRDHIPFEGNEEDLKPGLRTSTPKPRVSFQDSSIV